MEPLLNLRRRAAPRLLLLGVCWPPARYEISFSCHATEAKCLLHTVVDPASFTTMTSSHLVWRSVLHSNPLPRHTITSPEMAGPSSLGLLARPLLCLGMPGDARLPIARVPPERLPSEEAVNERLCCGVCASMVCRMTVAPCSLSMADRTSLCVAGSSSPSRCKDCMAATRCSCTVSFCTCNIHHFNLLSETGA